LPIGAYGIAINYREGSPDSELYSGFSWPIGMAVRRAMDTLTEYSVAMKWLCRIPLMAPAFILMVGMGHQADLITRAETCELQRRTIGIPPSKKETKVTKKSSSSSSSNGNGGTSEAVITYAPFLVQANLDHWITNKKADVQDSLPRTNLCQSHLKRATSSSSYAAMTLPTAIPLLWQMLCEPSIWDDQTIYGTIMCPASGTYTTVIDAPHKTASKSSKKGVATKSKKR
jgi:hypothetical protein